MCEAAQFDFIFLDFEQEVLLRVVNLGTRICILQLLWMPFEAIYIIKLISFLVKVEKGLRASSKVESYSKCKSKTVCNIFHVSFRNWFILCNKKMFNTFVGTPFWFPFWTPSHLIWEQNTPPSSLPFKFHPNRPPPIVPTLVINAYWIDTKQDLKKYVERPKASPKSSWSFMKIFVGKALSRTSRKLTH